MAPSTRTDPLEHVLLNVLKANAATDPYRLALSAAGVTTIDDLLDLSKSDLQALSYKDDEGVSHHLPIGKINTILSIRSWFQTQESTEDAVFLTLTPALLTTHCRSQASIAPAASTAATAAAVAASTIAAPSSHAKLSAADEFKKGIKHDINAFKSFKDRKTWNQWYHSFTSIAHAQGLGNVLDPTYAPSTPDEQALFDVLQDYTFAVFTSCLHEPQAAELVRQYTGTLAGTNANNAQKLHAALVKMMTQGIAAQTQ